MMWTADQDPAFVLSSAIESELLATTGAIDENTLKLAYKVQFVTYLTLNDLDNARFLWLRIPGEVKSDEELGALWKTAQSLWERDSANAFVVLLQFPWSDALRPFVSKLIEMIRSRNIALISKAYSSVSITECCNQLGMNQQQVFERIQREGWNVEGDFVLPKEKDAAVDDNANATTSTTADPLQMLTNIVMALGVK